MNTSQLASQIYSVLSANISEANALSLTPNEDEYKEHLGRFTTEFRCYCDKFLISKDTKFNFKYDVSKMKHACEAVRLSEEITREYNGADLFHVYCTYQASHSSPSSIVVTMKTSQ